MLRTVENMPDGYSPRRRAEASIDAYSPLAPMSPDGAADGTVSVDYEGWQNINHQVDIGTLNGTDFTAFANQMRKLAANCLPCGENSVGLAALTTTSAAGFRGAVLLNDGRVFIGPLTSTTARIYDPVTDTVITPSGTYPGTSFGGCVLMNDGRVFIIPANTTTARIYDPATDTLITPPGTYPGSNAFLSGCLLPDGRVFCSPRNSSTARIYDPVTNTLTIPSGTYSAGERYGCTLMSDGRVFIAPGNSGSARIYDPIKDTLITPNGFYSTASPNQWNNVIVLSDGKILIVPRNSTTARIYDPVTDTLSTPSAVFDGSQGGIKMFDDRILLFPDGGGSPVQIYDYYKDTIIITSVGEFVGGTNAYDSAVLLPDGRVLMPPGNVVGIAARISGQKVSNIVSKNLLQSPYYGKR